MEPIPDMGEISFSVHCGQGFSARPLFNTNLKTILNEGCLPKGGIII